MLAGQQQWSGKYLSCEWLGPVVPHNGWNVSYVAVPIQSQCVPLVALWVVERPSGGHGTTCVHAHTYTHTSNRHQAEYTIA